MPRSEDKNKLTLGELEPLTGTLLTVLLAFVFPRIASEKASLLEAGPKFTVEFDQSARNSQTDCIRLASDTTTMSQNQHIELVGHLGEEKSLTHRNATGFGREVLIEGTAVNRDVALTRAKENAGDRAFPATGSKMLLNLRYWHSKYLSLSDN
jgi:hypothetical protein